MYPILFQLWGLVIYTYGFALIIGIAVATFLIWRRARKLGFEDESVFDMVLFSVFLGLVFSRTAYVLGHTAEFGNEILKMLLITYFPGLDGAAALVGGLLGFLLFARAKKWPLPSLFDCIVKGLALGIAIVMMGAFFAGSYIGQPTTLPWGVMIAGHDGLRHPIALYYALMGFLLYVVLVVLDRRHQRDGLLSALFLIVIGFSMLIIEWFTESGFVFFSIHFTQVAGIASLISGFISLYFLYKNGLFQKQLTTGGATSYEQQIYRD